MRRLFVITAVVAIALAKPELYKEKEDFQYSRSSTDEGSKSGFYKAAKGNMGGNYEKAHNMDYLAQHQMGGLVNQVQGELGDASETKTGSVYTAGNSGGYYGSNKWDTSNLGGRNFQEGTNLDDSRSSQTSLNSGYTSSLHNSGYRQTHNSNYASNGQSSLASSNLQSIDAQTGTDYNGYKALDGQSRLASSNLQSVDASTGTNQNGYGAYQTGHNSESGYQRQSSSFRNDGRDGQVRLVGAAPIKMYIRPGTRVIVPVAVEQYNANAVNTEAESLSGSDSNTNIQPTSNGKHYESSYNYRKEWEKHDVVPEHSTVNPYLKNSELYENLQSQNAATFHSSGTHSNSNNYNNGYGSRQQDFTGLRQQSGSSMSSSALQQQLEYNMQQQKAIADSHARTHGAISSGNTDSVNQLGGNENPKSYQSSYSYHKSWERQGDPYVIKPSTNGLYETQQSQMLTDASHQYGSHYKNSHSSSNGGTSDCDEHSRVPRSYTVNDKYQIDDSVQQVQSSLEDLGQQTQTLENLEDLGQQTQIDFGNLEDLGQHTQAQYSNLEDLGQHTQTNNGNIEDLGQRTQTLENLEDLGQQTQIDFGNLEDLGQHTQAQYSNLEDLGQHTQNQFSNLEDLGQQLQTQWGKLEDNVQQTQEDFAKWGNQENLHQETQEYYHKHAHRQSK